MSPTSYQAAPPRVVLHIVRGSGEYRKPARGAGEWVGQRVIDKEGRSHDDSPHPQLQDRSQHRADARLVVLRVQRAGPDLHMPDGINHDLLQDTDALHNRSGDHSVQVLGVAPLTAREARNEAEQSSLTIPSSPTRIGTARRSWRIHNRDPVRPRRSGGTDVRPHRHGRHHPPGCLVDGHRRNPHHDGGGRW